MSKVRCGNKACKEYIEKDSAVHAGLSHYCDSDCMFASSSKPKAKTAKKSPKRKPKKPNPVSEEIRERVLHRDKFRCRACQKTPLNPAVHHIVYRGDFRNKPWENESSNQITLCNQPCHLTVVHGDKRTWQPILLGLVWLSEVENQYLTVEQFKDKYGNAN